MPGWHLAPQSQSLSQLSNLLDTINSQSLPNPDPIILSNEVLQLQHHEHILPMNFLNGMPGSGFWLAPIEPSLTSMERNVVMKVHEFDISDESFTTFSMANVYNEETYPNTQGTISIPSEITTPLQRINPICEYNHLYETLLQHTAFNTNIAQQQVHHENNLDQSSYNDNEYIEDVNLPEIMARQDQETKAVISTKSPGNIQKFPPREHDEEIELTPDWKNGSRKVRDSVRRMNGKNDSRIGKNLRSMECGKNDDLRFKCQHCSYASKRSDHLKSHMLTHRDEKRYKCNQCPYVTAYSKNLFAHITAHNVEKPYKCSYCPYMCLYRSHLLIHIRKHTGEKPYRCAQCLYATADSSCLRTHMRVHIAEKSYKCNQCSYATTYNGNLKKHMRRHSGEKGFR